MKKYRYHCIISNVPKGDPPLEVNWGRNQSNIYREWEEWIVLTEEEFEEYKKPYHATGGNCFDRLVSKKGAFRGKPL